MYMCVINRVGLSFFPLSFVLIDIVETQGKILD